MQRAIAPLHKAAKLGLAGINTGEGNRTRHNADFLMTYTSEQHIQ
jgi:hypothetical protein